jgi:small conductance mechanosensitive channel
MKADLNLVIAEVFNPGTLLGALCYALLFATIALILTRVVHVAVHRGSRYLSDPIASGFIAQFLQVIIVLGMLILYAHIVPALRSLGTALLTGASVGAIVLGLAAQTTLGNLVAGLSILLYHPFSLGDEIEINTPKGMMRGTITSLSLGYTMLVAESREQIIVPNSVMASAVMIRINRAASPLDAKPQAGSSFGALPASGIAEPASGP